MRQSSNQLGAKTAGVVVWSVLAVTGATGTFVRNERISTFVCGCDDFTHPEAWQLSTRLGSPPD